MGKDLGEMEEKVSSLKEIREKLQSENDLIENELERKKILDNKILLAGKSVLTPPVVPETPDEKWAREAKIRYKGTGMDPTI